MSRPDPLLVQKKTRKVDMDYPRTGVKYTDAGDEYFARRGLKKYAGVWSLWALGVGAVISGHYSGWNLGLASGGWGGMFIATIIISLMYLGLTFSIAEMSPALPHTGAAYSFARTAMGPWGGFITGLCENVEYILTPAVIVYFIGSYLTGIFETSEVMQPFWWIAGYIIFVGLNVVGVELSFKVTLVVTLAALAVLVTFWGMALPEIDFSRWALNIGADGRLLSSGHGAFLPLGIGGALAALPFAVWLFLAIEQLPLAAEESVDPKRDMPRGIIFGMFTLIVSAFLILFLNPSLPGVGSHALGQSGEPLLDGFKALFGSGTAKVLALIAIVGLISSFHTIIFAQGRQIYSLSRAGYFPTILSVTHGTRKTPHVAMIFGAVTGLSIMLVIFTWLGADTGSAVIGGTLLNMAVFGAMCSYVAQGVSFIILRRHHSHIERPYRSPFGNPGAWVTVIIALVTIYYQLSDPTYRAGVTGVAAWFGVAILYFAFIGRHKLILSPEEEFAMQHRSEN
jgi:ethanolamine permease